MDRRIIDVVASLVQNEAFRNENYKPDFQLFQSMQ